MFSPEQISNQISSMAESQIAAAAAAGKWEISEDVSNNLCLCAGEGAVVMPWCQCQGW